MIKALWHDNENTSSLRKETFSNSSPNMVHIQSLFSLISLGTERTIAKGLVPPTLENEMNVPYMAGEIHLPVKYGYSLVGKIMDKGHLLEGQLVHLLHPHQSECVVKVEDCYQIPKEIPAHRATLASNMETAINAIWDAELSMGDQVLVVGFGLIGALITQLAAQFPGVNVHIIEKNAARKKMANNLGFITTDDPTPGSYDLAFNTSGHEAGLQHAINAIGQEGRVIEMSWYGDKAVSIHLGGDFHWKRKRIISSQVGLIPSIKKHRWDYRRRKDLVFELLKNPIFDAFITKIIDFAHSPAFFYRLRNEPIDDLGVCIRY